MLAIAIVLIAMMEPEIFETLTHSSVRWWLLIFMSIEMLNNLAHIFGKKKTRWQ